MKLSINYKPSNSPTRKWDVVVINNINSLSDEEFKKQLKSISQSKYNNGSMGYILKDESSNQVNLLSEEYKNILFTPPKPESLKKDSSPIIQCRDGSCYQSSPICTCGDHVSFTEEEFEGLENKKLDFSLNEGEELEFYIDNITVPQRWSIQDSKDFVIKKLNEGMYESESSPSRFDDDYKGTKLLTIGGFDAHGMKWVFEKQEEVKPPQR